MELSEAIKTRRSIRVFSDKKMANGILEKILDAGRNAPSHCNTQGWKFIFINNPDIKNKIFEHGGSYVIKNAPYGIMILYNAAKSDNLEYQDWMQSGAMATQNMLLTIHDLGLGGCPICHLPSKKKLNKILNVQSPYVPISYIAFGYPKMSPVEIPRKNKLIDTYSVNQFAWPAEKTPAEIKVRRLLRKIYYKLPLFAQKAVFPFVDKFIKKFNN